MGGQGIEAMNEHSVVYGWELSLRQDIARGM